MRLIRSSLMTALGLPVTLALPLQPMATWASAVEPGAANQPAPATVLSPAPYRELRLQELIAISERPTARELRPHCLGALTLLDTHLTAFRWGFEPRQQLDLVIGLVEQACPAPLKP